MFSQYVLMNLCSLHFAPAPGWGLCRGSKGQQEGKGFGGARAPGSEATPPPGEVLTAVEDDQRWKIEPAGLQEWEAWLQKLKDNADIKAGNIYLQVIQKCC